MVAHDEKAQHFRFARINAIGGLVFRHLSIGGYRGPYCAEITQGLGHLVGIRSEEHTSELQSLLRISYAVFCLKKKSTRSKQTPNTTRYHLLTYADRRLIHVGT